MQCFFEYRIPVLKFPYCPTLVYCPYCPCILTLKMTAAEAIERSVTNNSLSRDYNNLDNQLTSNDTPRFKSFTLLANKVTLLVIITSSLNSLFSSCPMGSISWICPAENPMISSRNSILLVGKLKSWQVGHVPL